MAVLSSKFASASQEWQTPDSIFVPLNNEFKFEWDVCATKENAKCVGFYTLQDDGLSTAWFGRCWMNPPFNSAARWVKKAYESELAMTVALLPSRTNTNWWHTYCMRATEIRFVLGRPKFGSAWHGLPQPLAIVVFGYFRGAVPMLKKFSMAAAQKDIAA